MEKSIIKSNKAAILFNTLIIIAICNLIFIIKTELVSEKVASLSLLRNKKEMSFLDSKTISDMGWFNLKMKPSNYEKEADISFITFQYMIVPTILENNGYNKKIICYYTSPKQLARFCQKKKKYRLIEKDILSCFALLERID
jgi:hypothetical protein